MKSIKPKDIIVGDVIGHRDKEMVLKVKEIVSASGRTTFYGTDMADGTKSAYSSDDRLVPRLSRFVLIERRSD
ncbi:hypothetical protein [Candidatus Poriferisocius sp.]|uniref:hypothetical protein n=1 Tax=Candidatus Poriferisocius sp. TaxID=3101276 RepID=UPI003B015847